MHFHTTSTHPNSLADKGIDVTYGAPPSLAEHSRGLTIEFRP